MSNLDNIKKVLAQGDKEGAVKMLISTLRLNSNDVDAWLLLGEVIDDLAKKRDCYNQVLKLSPNNPLALKGLRNLNLPSTLPVENLQDTQPRKVNTKATIEPIQSNTVSCRTCQHIVSKTADSCPNCGELYPGLIEKCPHCGSKNIRIVSKGFSLGKAAAGVLLAGPIGLAGGLHGRKDLEVKCSNCNRSTIIKSDEIK